MPFKISTEIKDATASNSGGNYFSASKIKSGDEARFHIVSEEPTCYFECWGEDATGKSKSFRFPSQPTAEDIDQEMGDTYRRRLRDGKPEPVKPAIAFAIYNYGESRVELAAFTQKSLIGQLDKISNMDDYEDFDQIDFILGKEGSGLDTRYTLTPAPVKKGADEKLASAWNEASKAISFENYLAGDNPFTK